MGYEVIVTGHITFKDIKGFKKEFETIAQRKTSEIGESGDFDYFFTKMWGEHLEELDETNDNEEIEIYREGKLWYDEEKVMEFLAKYAHGTIECDGEDGEKWRFIISEDGTVKRQFGKNIWIDE